MKSVVLEREGEGLDGVRVVDAPIPRPGPGQVRVRMRLAPVHPSDLAFVHGLYRNALAEALWNLGGDELRFWPGGRTYPRPPFALGGEGMGVVEAAGPGLLPRRLVGKRVAVAAGPPAGSWQEQVVVDARRVVAVPGSIPDEQAAMLFVNPLTAWVMVHRVLAVRRGSWLLQTAAGSALGRMVAELCARLGARTIDVVRSRAAAERLRAAGARHVIVFGADDLVTEVARLTAGRGVPFALDCVGGATATEVVRCLGMGGHLVLYGTLDPEPVTLPSRRLMMPAARVSGFYLPAWLAGRSALHNLRTVQAVRRAVAAGRLRSRVEARFPLERVREAIAAATRPGRQGKVLLEIPA